jgi:hypothetical protein
MQVRLSRAEYWLLETVVDSPCPLTFLDAGGYEKPEGIEEMFNKPGHGLNHDELIEVLVQLAGHGSIEGYRGEQPIALDRQTIISAVAELPPRHNPSCVYYKLTQEGGAAWEAFAAPDWSRLVKEELDDDVRSGTLTGMVSWRLEKYLRYLDMLQCELDLQSIEVEEIGPWEATYWKILPHGHRAQFHWRHERGPGGLENEFSSLAFSGFCEFRDSWYHWR